MEPTPTLPFVVASPIRTERLALRLMTRDDIDDVYAYQSLEEVCRYLLFEPRDRAAVIEKVDTVSQATTLEKDGDYLQLALELPASADGPARVIGDSFFKLASVEDSRGEIGWTMNPEFTRRGYAAEAASAMLDIAFETIGLHRVIANLDPNNEASIALCLRLGMRKEAHFVQDMWLKGRWGDTGIYAILRDDWLARR
jgi:RimJ/RimL family protein N-acetyltransferase